MQVIRLVAKDTGQDRASDTKKALVKTGAFFIEVDDVVSSGAC